MMDYRQRVDRVIDFIGQNIDQDLSLETLSNVACFSKYHFHRIFTAYTGLSLKQYVKWLRLKRAAHQLIVERDNSIINIALDAGFESHEAFSRAFKQICGESPSEFRVGSNWNSWEKLPYSLRNEGKKMVDVTIKEMPARRLAVFEHKGDPVKLVDTLNDLISWAKSKPVKLGKPGEAFGFGYDDPRSVPAEDFRFDLAITVPDNLKLDGRVIERKLPAGRYAVSIHKGSRDNIGDTVYGMYREWLPKSKEELGDLPCTFCYYNFDHEVAQTELLTEVWLLLK